MLICKNIQKVKRIIHKIKTENKTIGFVPTMGALHEGHISLVKASKKETDFTVVSIFVNPLQFGPKEDFKKYPRDLKTDSAICRQVGVDLLFVPTDEQMYPGLYQETYVEQQKLSNLLCGTFRPGHFKGVMTVVAKLFNIVQPDIAYFGAKDYQQAIIIIRMVYDLNFNTKIKVMPTIRENTGLAMSSRNKYLNETEKQEAQHIYQSLILAKEKIIDKKIRTVNTIKKFIENYLKKHITTLKKIDYIEIVEPNTLESLKIIKLPCVILIALYIKNTRLIDNIYIS